MQREMLSHFIILSNKMSTRGDQTDGTSTCTRHVKKYSQNNKEWPLCVDVAARRQMMIWGPLPS